MKGKKSARLGLCLLLTLVLLLVTAATAWAAEEGEEPPADWKLKVTAPEGSIPMLRGSEYYLYCLRKGASPYVMIKTYPAQEPEKILEGITESLQEKYKDLEVEKEMAEKTVGDRTCYEIDYAYTVSGYDAVDRRIVLTVGDLSYVFSSRELPQLDRILGRGTLEKVIKTCEFTEEGAGTAAPTASPKPET